MINIYSCLRCDLQFMIEEREPVNMCPFCYSKEIVYDDSFDQHQGGAVKNTPSDDDDIVYEWEDEDE